MTKNNNNSSKVIYVISTMNKDTGKESFYVGSTYCFERVKWEHKKHIYNKNDKCYNQRLYKTIRTNNGNWSIKVHSQVKYQTQFDLDLQKEVIRNEIGADLCRPMRNIIELVKITERIKKIQEELTKAQEEREEIIKKEKTQEEQEELIKKDKVKKEKAQIDEIIKRDKVKKEKAQKEEIIKREKAKKGIVDALYNIYIY